MKLRTVGQLDIHLTQSIAWRKKELTSLKFAVDTAPQEEQKVLLRAATALLYAHWEGFIKDAGTAYLQFVARQNLSLGQLTSNFVAIGIARKIYACAQTRRVSIHQELVNQIKMGMSQPAKIAWRGVIKTNSNLKSKVFAEIVSTLGLDFQPFSIKAKPVIDKLVEARNGIAHGKGLQIDKADYDNLHREIIIMLDEFKTQIEKAASEEYFQSKTGRT